MSLVVLQQMIIIFILIAIGAYLYKTGRLNKDSTRDVSWMVVNITNPIMLLSAALQDTEKVDGKTLGLAFITFVVVYALLGGIAMLIPFLLGAAKEDRYAYRYMSIFANVGFIGIPFCSAVLGVHSLIYVSICNLTFNLIFYTIGVSRMAKIGKIQHPERAEEFGGISVKSFINSGTVFSLLTIVIYVTGIKLPTLALTTLDYIGRATTFLSMVILGVSVVQVAIKDIFGEWRLYLFTVIRQILVPIALIFILRPFIANELLLNTVILLIAMPCANLPLMTAKQYDVKESVLSSGIILTTIVSIITLPLVASLL